MKRLVLRLLLLYAALGWGICLVAVVAPSDLNFEILSGIAGIDPTPLKSDPIFDYWLRMASGAFGLIGLVYLALAWKPDKFAKALPIAGLFQVLEGVILLMHGLRLGLEPAPFYGDVGFCLSSGIGILCLRKAAMAQN